MVTYIILPGCSSADTGHQQQQCNPNPENPTGPCLTCLSIRGPTLSKQPCFRYIITDASLYREQKAPYQGFTRRWQTMDLVDIPSTGWASSEVRTITVSPNHVHAPLSFRVRQYIPVEGDLLEEVWMEKAQDRRGEVIEVERRMPVPRWAVLNMSEVAKDMAGYIEHNVATFITGSVATGAYSDESSSGRSIHGTLGGGSAGAGGFDGKGANGDALLWETYMMAFRHMGCAKTEEERSLLVYAFRLWVTCRLCSNPVHICGEETLGGRAVYSNGVSLHEGKVPMPLLMTAQFECINYTTFLRPWSRQVLRRLNELVLAKKREYWFTIYLTLFVLLHSCSMMTRRDEEFARQFGVRVSLYQKQLFTFFAPEPLNPLFVVRPNSNLWEQTKNRTSTPTQRASERTTPVCKPCWRISTLSTKASSHFRYRTRRGASTSWPRRPT